MNNPKLVYPDGARGALSNIAHGVGKWSSVIDLVDAVEDSNTAKELLINLKKLSLVGMNSLTIHRETDSYVRIKGTDMLGNVKYLIAYK